MKKNNAANSGKNEVHETLNKRDKLYGGFANVAELSQGLKNVLRNHEANDEFCIEKLAPAQAEALEMIMHKTSRILNGDPNLKDNWIDIAGYATLVADML